MNVEKKFVSENEGLFTVWEQYSDGSIGAACSDKEGNVLTDEERNCVGCGGVYDPAVLPEEIQDWWLGVVPGAAPAS